MSTKSCCPKYSRCGNHGDCVVCVNQQYFRAHKGAKFEKHIARERTKVLRDPQSGAYNKGDVRDKLICHECKETNQRSLAIQRLWLHKIENEAGKHHIPCLTFRFVGDEPWACIPYSHFMALLGEQK